MVMCFMILTVMEKIMANVMRSFSLVPVFSDLEKDLSQYSMKVLRCSAIIVILFAAPH